MNTGKGKSIITNFGCDKSCHYCIWKYSQLRNYKTTIDNTDWEKLSKFIKGSDSISISGGGDPLYNIDGNWAWFKEFFTRAKSYHVKLHTAVILPQDKSFYYGSFNKIALHLNYKEFKHNLDRVFSLHENIRLVFVLSENDLSKNRVSEICEICADKSVQLSFRELFIPDKTKSRLQSVLEINTKEIVKSKYSSFAKFVEQADYNIYYMPDNSIRTKFLENAHAI
jgi:pyruvate-formate lyase-activating enzyme